jgi:hypothetical protein
VSNQVFFRLDGSVSFVEVDKDGVEKVTPIDGKVVLNCLVRTLEAAVRRVETELPKECPKHKRYKGLRQPRSTCANCWTFYLLASSTG